MSNEMVARVARAICQAELSHPFRDNPAQLVRAVDALWKTHVPTARLAIAAMREPSGAMKDAGAETYGIGNAAIGTLDVSTLAGQPTKAWQAMIDAALNEPGLK